MKSSLIACLTVGALATFASNNALADPEGSIGISSITYNDTSTELGYNGRLGWSGFPFYIAGAYEKPKVRMLGQPLADLKVASVGLGFSTEVRKGLHLFAEGGFSSAKVDIHDDVRDEVIYTQLVGNHNVANRPIPIYKYPNYTTSYEVDSGYFARVGMTYYWKDIGVTVAYRALKLDQEYTLRGLQEDYDLGRAHQSGQPGFRLPGGQEYYWREDTELNLNSVEIGINWKF